MALSTKKKNIIRAEWKAGKYDTKKELLDYHKIDRKTLGKILGENIGDNTEIVEMGVKYESAKKSLKNPHEIKAIEQTVQQRIDTQEMDNILMKNTRKLAGAVLNRIAEEKEDIDIYNAKNVTSALKDIESIANPPKPNQVNIQQNNATQVILTSQQKRELFNKRRKEILE